QTESDRLEILITDLLDLSRIEQSGFHVEAVPTDMKAVIEHASGMVKQRLDEKSIVLETALEPVTVLGESNRLIQIIMNLLVNAITYSAAKTKIKMELFEEGGKAVIKVIDEGIGIEASEISRLFERFYRVDRARSRNSGGTGL